MLIMMKEWMEEMLESFATCKFLWYDPMSTMLCFYLYVSYSMSWYLSLIVIIYISMLYKLLFTFMPVSLWLYTPFIYSLHSCITLSFLCSFFLSLCIFILSLTSMVLPIIIYVFFWFFANYILGLPDSNKTKWFARVVILVPRYRTDEYTVVFDQYRFASCILLLSSGGLAFKRNNRW